MGLESFLRSQSPALAEHRVPWNVTLQWFATVEVSRSQAVVCSRPQRLCEDKAHSFLSLLVRTQTYLTQLRQYCKNMLHLRRQDLMTRHPGSGVLVLSNLLIRIFSIRSLLDVVQPLLRHLSVHQSRE